VRTRLLVDGSWAGELRQRTKDGRSLIVESRLQLEAFEGRRLVLECTRDITDRKLWERRQQLLLGELTHRVKNTLTVVQSIAHQTLRSTRSSADFVERFDGRLQALARAHNLLVESDWKGALLADLARDQLEPYTAEQPQRLRTDGEPILLPADIAMPFGLVLHELATNAAKHGALSQPAGDLDVSWIVSPRDGQRLLTLVWRERNGAPIRKPKIPGLGSALIDKGIPNAKVTREYAADGLVCTIELTVPASAETRRGPTGWTGGAVADTHTLD